jgi:hypothetical protein
VPILRKAIKIKISSTFLFRWVDIYFELGDLINARI